MDALPCEERMREIDMNERAVVGFKLTLLVRIRTTDTVRIGTVCVHAEITYLI